MANIRAFHSCLSSIVDHLRLRWLQTEPLGDTTCSFSLFSSSDMAGIDDVNETTLGCFLHRISIDEFRRNEPQVVSQWGETRFQSLPVSLHLLFFVIANGDDDVLHEQAIGAWLLRELHQTSSFDSAVLDSSGGWDVEDTIHLIAEEMDTETLTRIWQSVAPAYRLSFPYIARVIHLEADPIPDGQSVVATRMRMGDDPVAMQQQGGGA